MPELPECQLLYSDRFCIGFNWLWNFSNSHYLATRHSGARGIQDSVAKVVITTVGHKKLGLYENQHST